MYETAIAMVENTSQHKRVAYWKAYALGLTALNSDTHHYIRTP